MTWSAYGSFLLFATVLVLIPGADFTVVTRSALMGGRARGQWSAVGVASSNTVQGLAAVCGLGAVIARIEPLFEAVKWAGICYLGFLGVSALRSAARGDYAPQATDLHERHRRGWHQGFLSNITNPKVLVFYLAVLPQFLGPSAPIGALLLFALSHAALSLAYLSLVVLAVSRVRRVLLRRRVRRAMDLATGSVLIGFGTRLAVEHS